MNELYEAALKADKEGTLTEWMIGYLRDSGRNSVLADGLEEDGQFHTSLIDYPIEKLKILMGPDKSYRYYEEPETFNTRIDAMIESINAGWKPVPFVATKDLWNEGLELNDGAHRAEALKRVGIQTYPTIFYFKDQTSLDEFLNSL